MFLTRAGGRAPAPLDQHPSVQSSISGQLEEARADCARSPATTVCTPPARISAQRWDSNSPAFALFPSNRKENPRCAEAHLGYDVPYPNRLHTGWGLVGRRRDARLSGQSCPGAGTLPGGRGHTGLTRSPNRVKRVRSGTLHDCLRLPRATTKKRHQRCHQCGDRRRQRCSQTRALGHPQTPAGFYRPSARTNSPATRST